MPSWSIPIGLVAFIVLFAAAMVSTARSQRAAKRNVFRDYARSADLGYRAVDTGAARRFAGDFDGIGRFGSPSLGKLAAQDVATGTVRGREAVLFRHRSRFLEGYAREWFVVGFRLDSRVVPRAAIQMVRGGAHERSPHLTDPVVHRRLVDPFRVLVRAPSPAGAGRLMDPALLEGLAGLADALPFPPEIQIRGDRMAVYPAPRNATLETTDDLTALVRYAADAATLLG